MKAILSLKQCCVYLKGDIFSYIKNSPFLGAQGPSSEVILGLLDPHLTQHCLYQGRADTYLRVRESRFSRTVLRKALSIKDSISSGYITSQALLLQALLLRPRAKYIINSP